MYLKNGWPRNCLSTHHHNYTATTSNNKRKNSTFKSQIKINFFYQSSNNKRKNSTFKSQIKINFFIRAATIIKTQNDLLYYINAIYDLSLTRHIQYQTCFKNTLETIYIIKQERNLIEDVKLKMGCSGLNYRMILIMTRIFLEKTPHSPLPTALRLLAKSCFYEESVQLLMRSFLLLFVEI